jgi:hypothetical protein
LPLFGGGAAAAAAGGAGSLSMPLAWLRRDQGGAPEQGSALLLTLASLSVFLLGEEDEGTGDESPRLSTKTEAAV